MVSSVTSDLDEVEELREQLARAQQEVERLREQVLHANRIEATGTLAAGLAHDMNNVLASIMGFTEGLLEAIADSRMREDLEEIMNAAERGAGLTKSLLAFSRKGRYRKQVIELDATIRQVLPLLERTLPKGLEVQTELAAGRMNVDGDPAQLSQVIVNLALNAADAMPRNGVLVISSDIVEIAAGEAQRLDVRPGRYVRMRVTDTGCGMDAQTCARAFEPFFTTKGVGKGTGLGLALVWGVVKGHDGAIALESQPGVGTTVCIHLPCTNAAEVARPTAPKPHAKGSGATILVVDDEAAVRRSLTRLLGNLGYNVLSACNGAEALQVFEGGRNDIGLVILDMAMPVMGGAECAQHLLHLTTVPILISTGYALDEQVQALVARGVALLEKPYPAASLIVEITRLLEQQRQHHA